VHRLAVLCVALAAAAASAQMIGHPLPPGLRPFHERIADVDVVAVVRVERVDEGRLAVVREAALRGAPPERFEVKRSPLVPPPLATGDRALLLLRGALPPYVLADSPAEVIRIDDDAMAARWRDAVQQALARRGEPAKLVAVYRDWLAGGPETLREIGAASLSDLAAKHPALRAEVERALRENRGS
jgi:hypothetical protein